MCDVIENNMDVVELLSFEVKSQE